jgi:hypothetical protein
LILVSCPRRGAPADSLPSPSNERPASRVPGARAISAEVCGGASRSMRVRSCIATRLERRCGKERSRVRSVSTRDWRAQPPHAYLEPPSSLGPLPRAVGRRLMSHVSARRRAGGPAARRGATHSAKGSADPRVCCLGTSTPLLHRPHRAAADGFRTPKAHRLPRRPDPRGRGRSSIPGAKWDALHSVFRPARRRAARRVRSSADNRRGR